MCLKAYIIIIAISILQQNEEKAIGEIDFLTRYAIINKGLQLFNVLVYTQKILFPIMLGTKEEIKYEKKNWYINKWWRLSRA